nr:MAG TPA: hypothetical protein [Ackermannviridae sp.]
MTEVQGLDLNFILLNSKHSRKRKYRALYYAPIYKVYLEPTKNVYHFLLMNGKLLVVSKTHLLITFYNLNKKKIEDRYVLTEEERQSKRYIELITNINKLYGNFRKKR